MSFRNYNPNKVFSRNSNYQSRKNNNQRQRSRDHFHQNRQHDRYNKNEKNQTNNNKRKNNFSKQYGNTPEVIHEVHSLNIGNPKVYLIWKHSKNTTKQQVSKSISFDINVTKSNKPPPKIQPQSSRLSELKNDITPVEQIWGQVIKQYLNDSEFVQIYRKKNSLAYSDVSYGKTIIKYDGLNEKSYYDNKESQYNIFSRAYFKLWQILSLGILDSKREQDIIIANLAQGPGGFIHSLIDFRLKQNKTLQDRYYAITLKIQQGKTRMAKDWSDPRGISFFQKIKKQGYKVKLSYGQTGNGNLYDVQNIESFKNHVMEGRQAFLVTGDGGIQCIGDDEFHYQEIFNGKLFFSEILTAFTINQLGGTFILKIYDIHFQITAQLIILLSTFYRKVGIIKPLTSRPGNSQKYILCQGFFGISKQELEKLKSLLKQWHQTQNKLSYFQNAQFLQSILTFKSTNQDSKDFQQTIRQRIKLINEQLSQQQEKKIQQGLKLIQKYYGDKQRIKRQIREQRFQYQLSYAYEWCKKYGLKTINIKVNEVEKKEKQEQK